ncbi:MAG: hypothetical protein J2P33_03175 [Actinobacteria bacterium]|nr:hypothetical protein [Actinomycetota bacterium]
MHGRASRVAATACCQEDLARVLVASAVRSSQVQVPITNSGYNNQHQ